MLQMYGIEDRAVYTGAGNYTYTSIDIGCDDKIWLGTYTNGVKYFNEISGTVYQAVGPPEFSTTSILNILVDDNCNIWAGTSGSGLFRYDEEKDRFIPVEIRSRNSPAQIYHIRQNEQILMLATEQGVFKLSKDTGETVNLFREAGWPSQTVYAVIEDSNGDWWMSTNNGLIHYSEASGELARFTQSSGLPVREFIRSSAYKHDDGTLFFGSMDGLISFHPDDLHSDQIIPPVQLKEVRKSGKDGVEILNMMEGVPPVLDHTHHSVTFSYLAMNYTNPSQNQYRYRLYPLDNEWIDAGYSREAHYLNIPPGEYRFEVQAAVGRNLWGNTAFVDLKMMPPFWRTGWFFLLIGALLAGILYMIHYYRVTQLLKVERMRMQIAGDLHDEVGGNLSSISLMTDLINKTDDLEPLFKNRIKRVHETSRKTMEAMSDIVWAIHPDNDKLEDLILKLRDTASELLQNISYRFKVDSLLENEKIQVHFKRDFYLIFKEALHNLVKHSGATEAEISIRKKGKCIQLTIQDNGKGFNTGAVHKGYGIINMQRRSKKMDADFEITSKKDEGTTVMLLTKIT
ncbi:MAG: hypothetical protein EA391_02880 [Balneolaceae bacterium]|nr:MAG: hypothetical protein EA391_02880 [Balneolaceae bacterium]